MNTISICGVILDCLMDTLFIEKYWFKVQIHRLFD